MRAFHQFREYAQTGDPFRALFISILMAIFPVTWRGLARLL